MSDLDPQSFEDRIAMLEQSMLALRDELEEHRRTSEKSTMELRMIIASLVDDLEQQKRLNDSRYEESQRQSDSRHEHHQRKARDIMAALNLNMKSDKHAYQSIEAMRVAIDGFRQTLASYEQGEAQRQELLRDLNKQQDKKTDKIEGQQKQQNRNVMLQAVVLIILAVAYATGEFQAGEVVQAIAVLATVGVWGAGLVAKS